MLKFVSKFVSYLMLIALITTSVAAAAPERAYPPTDNLVTTAEDQEWLDKVVAAGNHEA